MMCGEEVKGENIYDIEIRIETLWRIRIIWYYYYIGGGKKLSGKDGGYNIHCHNINNNYDGNNNNIMIAASTYVDNNGRTL